MAKYFRTTNASRRYKVQGQSFEFERLSFASGAWAGVIETNDEAGELLASYGPPITEISENEYIELKKKNGKYYPPIEQQVSPKSQEAEETSEESVADDLETELSMSSVEVKDPLESIET